MQLDRLEHKNIVWTMEFCEECERVKKELKDKNITFEERKIEEIMEGSICFPEAIRQLIENNFAAPIVILNNL